MNMIYQLWLLRKQGWQMVDFYHSDRAAQIIVDGKKFDNPEDCAGYKIIKAEIVSY